jgi:hypothetical protein
MIYFMEPKESGMLVVVQDAGHVGQGATAEHVRGALVEVRGDPVKAGRAGGSVADHSPTMPAWVPSLESACG